MYYSIGSHSDPPSSLNAATQAPGFLLLIPPPPTLFLLFATPILLHHALFPPTSCFPLFSVLSLQNNQSVGYKLTNEKVKKNQWIIKIIFSFTGASFQWTFGSGERKQVLFYVGVCRELLLLLLLFRGSMHSIQGLRHARQALHHWVTAGGFFSYFIYFKLWCVW